MKQTYFRGDDFDDFLEAAFFGDFTTAGVLKAGTTVRSFSIEDRALDIAQYRIFTGCMVNTFSLSVAPNAIATATFGIVGKNMAISGTSVDPATTAASGNAPFDSFTGTITEGGSAIAIVTSLDMTLENNLNPTFIIGSALTPQMEYGQCRVTGTMQVYFQDAALINRFINETASSLSFALTDGTTNGTYTFNIPSIKYTGADVPVAGTQSRLISMPFTGTYNAGQATTIKITKS